MIFEFDSVDLKSASDVIKGSTRHFMNLNFLDHFHHLTSNPFNEGQIEAVLSTERIFRQIFDMELTLFEREKWFLSGILISHLYLNNCNFILS